MKRLPVPTPRGTPSLESLPGTRARGSTLLDSSGPWKTSARGFPRFGEDTSASSLGLSPMRISGLVSGACPHPAGTSRPAAPESDGSQGRPSAKGGLRAAQELGAEPPGAEKRGRHATPRRARPGPAARGSGSRSAPARGPALSPPADPAGCPSRPAARTHAPQPGGARPARRSAHKAAAGAGAAAAAAVEEGRLRPRSGRTARPGLAHSASPGGRRRCTQGGPLRASRCRAISAPRRRRPEPRARRRPVCPSVRAGSSGSSAGPSWARADRPL